MIGVKLPNAIDPNIEKALGVFWDLEKDNLYMSPAFKDEDKSFLQGHEEVKSSVQIGIQKGSMAGGERTSNAMNEVKSYAQGSMTGIVKTSKVKLKLTLRICLSFHSKPYNPLGFVLHIVPKNYSRP